MNSITHLFIGWSVANLDSLERRDRLIVTIGGVLPDIDSIGIVPELITGGRLDWFSRYHHLIAHNLLTAVIGLLALICFARQRFITGVLFIMAFHIHLLGDVLGGRGPEGYQWPILYLWPFSSDLSITWQYQWALNSWQNLVITIIFIIMAFWLARIKGYSIVGLFSTRADAPVVDRIKKWF